MYETDLDRIDRKILGFLQEHGRASNLELAEAAGLSPAQCHRRHRRLEEAGYIARYETRLAPARLDLHVVAFILVAMEKGHIRDLSKFTDVVTDLPEVLECYSITGDYDFFPFAAEHIAQAIPGAHLVTLKNCGHFPYLECPVPLREQIDAFFHAR